MKLTRIVPAALLLVAAQLACTTAAASEIVLATWGGTWGKAIAEQAIAPFEKATGVTVRVISGVSLGNIQMIAAQRAAPKIDLVMATTSDAATAYGDGLLAPLDPKEIPSLAQLPESGVRRDRNGAAMFAGMWVYPYGIIYRTDKVKDAIKCWKDLWRPDLKNRVGVSSPKYMNSYFLLMANKLAGGSEADVAPGLEMVKKMGSNLVAVVDDSAGQQRMLGQGEVWAVPMVSSAAYKLIDEGVPAKFVIPCEGAPAGMDVVALVKNGPNPSDAKKFIDFYLRADTIANVTRELKITPVNRHAKLTPEHAKYTVSDEDFRRLVTFSEPAIAAGRAKWQDAWDREIAPMTRR
ncbi:MAG TPA: extracellular solute-binding protein [Ramlibacter sp.]|uniref:extracellular solute-binding protein n=1 Tax=Ramlibacter sp. TaxID=1917967 RepID=UPI002BF207B6|nr:extracellular solute-binding protein [Ramlibacter sp.]HVZ45599.1 extracellular solute-binding protein [Ramlibacter sp.]